MDIIGYNRIFSDETLSCIDNSDLRAYLECMREESCTIGDTANIRAGCAYRGAESKLPEGDIPFVGYRNVDIENGIDWPEVARVKLDLKRDPHWLEDGDILFASRGMNTYAYPVVNPPPKATCSPQFFVVTPKRSSFLSSEFLAWQINQAPAQSYLSRFADASTIRNIRRDVLSKMPISIPSMERQIIIANFAKAARRTQQIHRALIDNTALELSALAHQIMNGKIQ